MRRVFESKFRVPDYINAAWLNEEHVVKNGFVPEAPKCLEDYQGGTMRYQKTPFGNIPVRSRTEITAGDIVIFDSFEQFEDTRGYFTDRFYIITKEDMQEFYDKQRELLPCGVIVHPPRTQ